MLNARVRISPSGPIATGCFRAWAHVNDLNPAVPPDFSESNTGVLDVTRLGEGLYRITFEPLAIGNVIDTPIFYGARHAETGQAVVMFEANLAGPVPPNTIQLARFNVATNEFLSGGFDVGVLGV